MITSFSLKNYRSFKDLHTLSLDSSGSVSARPIQFAAIYGANASGKSNILKALEYVKFAVQNTDAINKQTLNHQLLQSFRLNDVTAKEPSFFELELFDAASETRYRYGFEVSREHVAAEWLLETAKRTQNVTERQLFTRTTSGIEFDSTVPKEIRALHANIPETILALPFLANNNFLQARAVADLIVARIVTVDAANLAQVEAIARQRLLDDHILRARVSAMLRELDFGIQQLNVNQIELPKDALNQIPDPIRQFMVSQPANARVTTTQTTHNMYDTKGEVAGSVQFDLVNNESLGTQKLIPFLTMVLDVIDQGLVVVADEFGSSFHPFITAAIAKMFQDREHSAQLIVLSHETYLLTQDINLEKSQIWFVEKNRQEESSLICLDEYKPRGDARVEKQYLEGRFGAVPIILDGKE